MNDIKINTESFAVLDKTHKAIINLVKDVSYKIFPLYVKYYVESEPVIILYYKGKFIEKGELDLGVNLKTMPKDFIFRDADYMKDGKIKYSTKVDAFTDISSLIKNILQEFNK